jgi:CRP/FNR family transcriptional regulator
MPTLARIKKISLFKDLTNDELKKVSKIIKTSSYRKGAMIWDEGNPEQGLHIIDSGKVRVTRLTKEGNKQVLAVLKKDNFFGELSLLDGRSHSASVEALKKTDLFIIRKTDMDKFLNKNPKIAYKIVRDMAIEISQILRSMNDKFINMVDFLWD